MNAASRLLVYMRKAYDLDPSKTCNRVWAEVFKVDRENYVSIFDNLNLLRSVSRDAQTRLSALTASDKEREMYLECYPKINRILFYPNLKDQWSQCRNYINEGDLKTLGFGAHLIDKFSPESEIPDEELRSILNELNEVHDSILKSSMATELKLRLIELIEVMQSSITNYRITGNSGVSNALDIVRGRLMLVGEALKGEDEEAIGVFKKIVVRIHNVLMVSSQYLRLLESMGLSYLLPFNN